MKRLLLIAALALSALPASAQSVQEVPWPGVTMPTFVIPASLVNGSGTFTPQLFGPQSCTVPAYSFTSATTSGYGLASSAACTVIGGTARQSTSATASTFTVPILEADGTASAPSYSFASESTLGWFRGGSLFMDASTNGTARLRIDGSNGGLVLKSDWALLWSSGLIGASPDVSLSRGATHRLQAGASDNWYIPSGGMGVGAVPTATAWYTAGAGTTAIAPVVITNGTNLTTATANSIENDGTAFYKTVDTTNGRFFDDGWQYFRLTGSGTGITTIADFFGANSAIPLVANGVYEVEWNAYFSQVTAGTATWTVTTATTALANITGEYMCSNIAGIGTVGAPQTAAINTTASSATAFPVTGTEATAVTHFCRVRAMLTAGNGASNTRLRLTMGAGTATPLINSYFRVRHLPGGNTGTFVP